MAIISKWTEVLYKEEIDKILSVVLPISSILLSAIATITPEYQLYKQFVSVIMLPASVWATTNALLSLYGERIPEVLRNILIILLAFPLSMLSGLPYIIKYGLLYFIKLFVVSIPFFLAYSYLLRFLIAMGIESIVDWLEDIFGAVILSTFVIIMILVNVFAIVPIMYSIWSFVVKLLGF